MFLALRVRRMHRTRHRFDSLTPIPYSVHEILCTKTVLPKTA